MEKSNTKYLTRIDLKWGLILAAFSLLWVAVEKWLGWYSLHIASYVRLTNIYAFPALLIYCLALMDKRERDYNGQCTWKQRFTAGMMITIIVLLLTPLLKFIAYTFIAPEYFANIIDYGVTVKKKNVQALTAFFNMKNMIVQSVYGTAIMGTLASLIAATIVKKQRDNA